MTISAYILLMIALTLMPRSGNLHAQQETPSTLPSFTDIKVPSKELGCTVKKNGTTFRLFAPRATNVTLVLYSHGDDETGEEIRMVRDKEGTWEYTSLGRLYGKYYGYRVSGPAGSGEMFDSSAVIGDPYSKAVVTKNTYRQQTKTLILNTKYNWGNDTYVLPSNHNELIIYEAHIRDLTAHISSGVAERGTYTGLTEEGKIGGFTYLKDLGVNAVEFLPLQKFGTIEIPYRDSSVLSDLGEFNTWNPYARNHWGYMTSYFFAPETYYASDGTIARNELNGIDGRAVKEFKDLVKALHKERIAVIMDVVYNHVSQYDYNPFKYIDKFYYFHCDSSGQFLKSSGCGNDFSTERPMARKLIIESVKYWMKEYHIDGFRFDLATMIDWETCKEIAREAKKINPNVILIAEPWGGGKYDPAGFSDIGWASWNDHIRNGVKGQNPNDGLGFIFGKHQGSNTKKSVQSFITGTLREDGGLYVRKEHSINYLESHDDNTMGDFIRLATGTAKENEPVSDMTGNATLTPKQLALSKLAAMFLFVSQGPVMIAEGQEFARSKVIARTDVPDPRIGMIDHNSYEKDNETNYLNYRHRDLNRELYDYYRGLIGLRKTYPALSSAPKSAVEFLPTDDDYLILFTVRGKKSSSSPRKNDLLIILNGNNSLAHSIALPKGKWGVLADEKTISPSKPFRSVTKTFSIPPTSGCILVAQ